MATSTIRIKTDTTANWKATDRVLEYKEIAIEVKTNGKKAFKTGDGVTGWNELPYLFDPEWVETEVNTANGYAANAAAALAACQAVLAEIADKTVRRYGVRWLADSTAAKGTRLGDAARITKTGVQIEETINENEFDGIYPWCDIRRCNGDWNLETGQFEVKAYEFGTDGVKNPDFKVDGTNGNVWVEIPLFWAKHTYDTEKEENGFLDRLETATIFRQSYADPCCAGRIKPILRRLERPRIQADTWQA